MSHTTRADWHLLISRVKTCCPVEETGYTPRKPGCAPKNIDYAFTFIFSRAGLAAGRVARPAFLDRHSWYATNIGAATAIEEYVPIRIPMTSAREKPRSTSPPNTYNESTVRNVKPDVKIVRLRVWLMLLLTTSASSSRRSSLMFSRMRSYTTMVSFIEYPMRVRMAAITVSVMSLFSSEKNPMVMMVSWKHATTAPMP